MKTKTKKIMISLAGIRFDRGMGEFVRALMPYLAEKYKENLVVISNTSNLPLDIENTLKKYNVYMFLLNLSLPIFEQLVIPFLIKKFNVDIVYFPANTFPLIKPKDVKYVVTIHDLLFFSDETPKVFRQRLGKVYRRMIVKKGIDKVDLITSPSTKVLEDISTLLRRDNLKLLYNAFDFDRVKSYETKDILMKLGLSPMNYCYTITGIASNKNFPFLIKAFLKLKQIKPETKLVISGVSKEEAISVYGDLLKTDEKGFVFTGYIRHEEVLSLMKYSLAFLMLSKDEGFGRPIIEALWVGVLVVASDIPVFREIGKDFVEYVDIKDELCLVKLFRERYDEAYRKVSFRRNEVIDYVLSNFDAKKVSSELINILDNI